ARLDALAGRLAETADLATSATISEMADLATSPGAPETLAPPSELERVRALIEAARATSAADPGDLDAIEEALARIESDARRRASDLLRRLLDEAALLGERIAALRRLPPGR